MSEIQAPQLMGFGFQDDTDEDLLGKSLSGQFGLNQNIRLTKFEYNANAGKDGAAADAIDIHFDVSGQEQRRRIYDITRVFDKDGNEITDRTSDEFINLYNAEWKQNSAMIVHVLKCFVSEQVIRQALAAPAANFAAYAQIVAGLIPQGFEQKPLDLFLEYQWAIPEGKDQTYLQVPKNMKGGRWVCPALPGTFEAKTAEDGSLTYVNEQGNEHPFTRNASFMDSNKAKKQTTADALDNAQAAQTPATSGSW